MNAILRWAGSKRQLIPTLQGFWTGAETRYIEPFCGSACLFFAFGPSTAILGDLNSELIHTYQTLRADATSVIEKLQTMRRSKRDYYKIRAVPPDDMSGTDRAARFLYLNRHCFNGIYRTNGNGDFNVPYGPQKQNSPVDTDALMAAASLLQRATLIAADFSATLKHARKGDFVFIDPPYAIQRRRIFREYHPDSFSLDDLEILAVWLDELDQRGANFVVSYGDSREARELLRPWSPRRIRIRRNIAGFASKRRYAFELLVLSCVD